jgi:hypothetical protein
LDEAEVQKGGEEVHEGIDDTPVARVSDQ